MRAVSLRDSQKNTERRRSYYIIPSNVFFFDLCLSSNSQRVDHRTRRDRTEQRNKAFDAQMPVLTDAYMDWTVQHAERDNPLPDPPPSPNDGEWSVRVINLFSEHTSFINIFYSLTYNPNSYAGYKSPNLPW